jgi:prepilin-type N-terminal cleavage/methylation domain-containing protein
MRGLMQTQNSQLAGLMETSPVTPHSSLLTRHSSPVTRPQSLGNACGAGFAGAQPTILPLPRGEGRGEGERAFRSLQNSPLVKPSRVTRPARPAPIIHHPSSTIHHPSRASRASRAFTLIELLVVISIIALVAAMAGPVLKHFRPNITASATRQLLDDLARARQLAITQHTTVYVIFVTTNFWTDQASTKWTNLDWRKATNVMDKQMIGYTFVSTRSLGDQPGQPTKRYLASWKALPEGTFIPPFMFTSGFTYNIYTNGPSGNTLAFSIPSFYPTNVTANVPFPAADTPIFNPNKQPYVRLPYIAFDYLGRLYREGLSVPPPNALIPLAKGTIGFARNASKMPTESLPSVNENPPGNWTNTFNVVVIDGITGHARLEHL